MITSMTDMTEYIDLKNRNILFLFRNPKRFRAQWNPKFPAVTDLRIDPDQLADHISTDHIIRVADLLTDDQTQLGKRVFCGMPPSYGIKPGLIVKFGCGILVSGPAFGIGSSREQAVSSLVAAGIKIVIAGSFGPIFEKNAANLGLLTSTNYSLVAKIMHEEKIPLEEFTKGKDKLTSDIITSGGLFAYLKRIRTGTLPTPTVRKRNHHPMNIWEKRLATVTGQINLSPDDTVLMPIHQAYSYVSLSGPARQALISAHGHIRLAIESDRIHLFEDHFAYSPKPEVAALTANQRLFAAELHVPKTNYHIGKSEEGGGSGICHRVMLESVNPTQTRVIIATDSHTPTLGALPIIAIPVGSTFFAAALSEKQIPITVGYVTRVILTGKLPHGVTIRDAQLELASIPRKSTHKATVIEFGGPGLKTLSVDQVAALCNMVPEIFMGDIAVTEAYPAGIELLQKKYRIPEKEAKKLYGTPAPHCEYAEIITFDLSKATPWIAKPGRPNDSLPLAQLDRHPQIQKAYLACCTNGLSEIIEAAAVLKDNQVHSGTDFVIVPSSAQILQRAKEKGILEILKKSGAKVRQASVCSVCIGDGPDALGENETAISATNRNFPGRMGHVSAKVYLGGSILTALSAKLGRIPTYAQYEREIPRIIRNIDALMI
jgi:3-isopropylmalate/(R)-2-methylmalate dehydratase large subunit